MPLYLTEQDVEATLTPADAVEAIEASFRHMAAGAGASGQVKGVTSVAATAGARSRAAAAISARRGSVMSAFAVQWLRM